MANQSKRYRKIAEKRKEDPVPIAEAVNVLKGYAGTKFDQSVEVAIRLGIDQAQADQNVRGSIVLPHGIGKQQRVVVFAKGAKADEAREAGAEVVGEEDLGCRHRDKADPGRQGESPRPGRLPPTACLPAQWRPPDDRRAQQPGFGQELP